VILIYFICLSKKIFPLQQFLHSDGIDGFIKETERVWFSQVVSDKKGGRQRRSALVLGTPSRVSSDLFELNGFLSDTLSTQSMLVRVILVQVQYKSKHKVAKYNYIETRVHCILKPKVQT
jgi:hypothetical protein